jgi:Cdc6-like AAA superfamily ATPase
MFLVDKYNNELDYISNNDILNKIIDSFDIYNDFYKNPEYISKMSNTEFADIINKLDYDISRYANFQHLIIHGPPGSGKDYIINKILQKFFGKANIELKDI